MNELNWVKNTPDSRPFVPGEYYGICVVIRIAVKTFRWNGTAWDDERGFGGPFYYWPEPLPDYIWPPDDSIKADVMAEVATYTKGV